MAINNSAKSSVSVLQNTGTVLDQTAVLRPGAGARRITGI
jgi:hypothetical protein